MRPPAFVGSVGCEMNSMTEERIARNDSIFRDANEQINASAIEHDTGEEQAVPFICECADEHCTTIVPLSRSEYEDVRTDSRQFLTVFGHERFEGLVEVVSTNHNHRRGRLRQRVLLAEVAHRHNWRAPSDLQGLSLESRLPEPAQRALAMGREP
jgi:hypothetical protein